MYRIGVCKIFIIFFKNVPKSKISVFNIVNLLNKLVVSIMNKTLIFITSILMWGANLSAAPVFTDIEPDTTIAADVGVILSYYIDFNGDGEDELELCHFYGDDSWNNIEAYSAGQHCEICAGQWSGPVIMNKDDKISSKNSWVCTNSGSSNSALFMNPDWLGVVDKYMGIRFKVDGNWHYAWVVLDVFADNSGFTVKEYAYESEPGTAISAGDRGASSVIRTSLLI